MTLLFKTIGFVLIISASSFIGFLKSNELLLRYKRLCEIEKNIAELKSRIRLHSGELERLLLSSFGEYPISYAYLKKEDIEILEDFFENLGKADTKTECEKCELYIKLINDKIKAANAHYQEVGKLYKNIGIFSGIFICIFLI